MSVSFNTIPSTTRLPLAYIEFDNSNAVSGTPAKNNKLLLIGLKLATGTASANEPVRITRAAQGDELFGRGSMLSEMIKYFINANATATCTLSVLMILLPQFMRRVRLPLLARQAQQVKLC